MYNPTESKQKKIVNRVSITSATNIPAGVSSLCSRLVGEGFSEQHNETIGVDLKIRNMRDSDPLLKMQIYDLASSQRFLASVTTPYLSRSQQILLVFDLTDKESLTQLSEKLAYIKIIKQQENLDVPILLVGTKSDLQNEIKVTKEDVETFCQTNQISMENYFVVSSKTDDDVGISLLKEALITNALDPNKCPPPPPETDPNASNHAKKSKIFSGISSYSAVLTPSESVVDKLDELRRKRRGRAGKYSDPYATAIDNIKKEVEEKGKHDYSEEGSAFNSQDSINTINENIKKLQWTLGSLANTALNVFITATVIGAFAGAIYDCFKSQNNPTKGNPFLFVNKGLKQKVETAVAPHIKDLKTPKM